MKLSPIAVREDLTDRECSRIIGGLLGSLIQMSSVKALRNAVRWWAEADDVWVILEGANKLKEPLLAKSVEVVTKLRSGNPKDHQETYQILKDAGLV